MSKSKETFGKKEVRNKQLKKRKNKEKRRLEKKEDGKKTNFEDMLAWVDENGQIIDSPPDLSDKEEVKTENIEVSVPKGGNKKSIRIQTGRVNNFDVSKGFGFITSSQLNESVFVHINDCTDQPKTGDEVEFETEKGPKGLKAVNVKLKK